VKRVLIVGGPGAGKSTLAVELGSITGLPVYHFDLLAGPKPGKNKQERIDAKLDEIQSHETWIIDGLFSDLDRRISLTDVVVFMNPALARRILNTVLRWYRGNGIAEDPTTTPVTHWNTLVYTLTKSQRFHRLVIKTVAWHQDVLVVHLRSNSESSAFLRGVAASHCLEASQTPISGTVRPSESYESIDPRARSSPT
jgi:hypothetical protein